MSRVALLVGVSRYEEEEGKGLEPLPDAQNDVEALQHLLQQPRFQFEVECLCDRPLPEMQVKIERFFRERASDDQIVFLLCGYTLRDAEGRFYFATLNTTLGEAGTIVKAEVISASVLQDAMGKSPAKQQVLILDTYDQPVPNQPTDAKPSSDLAAQLGGENRVILAASNGNRPYPTPTAIDAWTYTRYLIDGIESGAADTDDDGNLTAADLHKYVTQKLKVAAPGLFPQLYGNPENGSLETAQIPLFAVPHDDLQVQYRKILETAASAYIVDATGAPMLESRSLLAEMQQQLGVSTEDAAAQEATVLRPVKEYRQRIEYYQAQVADHAQSHDVDSPSIRQALKPLQQALCLTDNDVAMQAIAPSLAEHQRQQAHYQAKRAQYEQVLLGAMQRRSPLREGDQAILRRWQQLLRLKDDDVQATKTLLTGGLSTEKPNQKSSEPLGEEALVGSQENTELDEFSKKSRIEVVTGFAKRDSEQGQSEKSMKEEPPDVVPPPSHTEKPQRPASDYQALIVPAILLAAIVGLVAAVLSSGNRPDWFKFNWFEQTPPDPAAAERLKNDGLRKAREGFNKEAIDDYSQAIQKDPNDATAYINRGMAHHKLGDTGAAIRDYEQALKLDPNSALSHSNLSYAHYDRQDYDKALDEGNKAVALNGSLAQAHINLANARAKKGDTVNALRDYTQAIALSSSAEVRAGAYNNQGNVKLALNRISEAISDYTQAIRLKPDYADAYYNLGLARQAQGNRPAAIRSLQRAASYYQQQNKPELQKEANDRAIALQKGS